MGQPPSYAPAAPNDAQIARLTARLMDLAERMTDEQILDVADALHDRLRQRRRLRGRSQHRVEGRLNLMV